MSKKKTYEDKLKAQLDEWSATVDVLKARADKAGAGAKIKYYETIKDLQKKQGEAQSRLRDLQNASEDAWEDLKEGIENAWASLGSAIKSAKSDFR